MSDNNYVGRQIGKYLITAELAKGAFGCVYLAQHPLIKTRTVAIKLLHEFRINTLEERESFLQEAEFLDILKHPHILLIYDVDIEHDIPYIVAEYAPKGSLRNRLRLHPKRPLPIEEALSIITQIGQALQYAHSKNIIHCDLKPENVLFNAKNEALLSDLGISTMLATASFKQGSFGGTPAYMAPEQFRGIISAKSDQYSLGCIAYELVTGRKPFTATNFYAYGVKHALTAPTAPTKFNAGVPAHVEQAILKAMAKWRVDRYIDMAAFIDALNTPPATPRPRPLKAHINDTEDSTKTKGQWLAEGIARYAEKRYEAALLAFEKAISLDANDAVLHYNYGLTLHNLNRKEEALAACEQAIQLDPHLADAYVFMSIVLCDLGRCSEAVGTFEQAIQFNPDRAVFYYMKGLILCNLKRYNEAVCAFDCAIQLDPKDAILHYNKAIALYYLHWYEDALAAHEQAILLDENYASAYKGKGDVLQELGRLKEAEQAYEKAEDLGFDG